MNTDSIVKYLKEAMSDGTHASSSRLIAVGVFFCGVVIPSLVWAGATVSSVTSSVLSGKMPVLLDMPGTVVGFMAASGALAGTLLAVNKNTEIKSQ